MWNDMGINYKDFTQPYSVNWVEMLKNGTNTKDKIYLILSFLFYAFSISRYEKITVSQQLKDKLTPSAMDTLSYICYLVDGVPPDIMTISELFGLFNCTVFYEPLEMSKPSNEGLVKEWINKLLEFNNISVLFETELTNISVQDGMLSFNLGYDSILLGGDDQLILSTDPLSLVKLLADSDDAVKNNWGEWSKIQNFLMKGIYTSISVQFHFSEKYELKLPSVLKTEWGIICAIVPFTPTISCSIINMSAFSSFMNKKVSECNPDEIKQEVWRQLSEQANLPNFSDITMGEESSWNGKIWKFGLSSLCRTVDGYMNPFGKRNDIAIVGPINYRWYPATTMEASVESVKRFVGEDVHKPITLLFFATCIIVIVLILIRIRR